MLKRIVILMIGLISGNAIASDEAEIIQKAQEKLKRSFANITATHFGPSPIDGVYEIMAGSRLIYYVPENEVLIFGEIFSKEGRSLTAERVALLQKDKVKEIDMTHALVLGNGDKTIIEFTNPECGYCSKLHKSLRDNINVKRKVFFTLPASQPIAKQKAIHILCSADKDQAFDEIFTRKLALSELTHCEEGKRTAELHNNVSAAFGVSGTPTVILGNSVVTGFREAQIAQYIEN